MQSTPPRFRRAEPHDAQALEQLQSRSASHWNYPEGYFDWAGDARRIRESYIRENTVFVLLDGQGRDVGFYSFTIDDDELLLDKMFVDVDQIGRGHGRILWEHAVGTVLDLGRSDFIIGADPNAAPFYESMGAEWYASEPTEEPTWTVQMYRFRISRLDGERNPLATKSPRRTEGSHMQSKSEAHTPLTQTPGPSPHEPWHTRLLRRWPTALALAMTAVGFGGKDSPEIVAPLLDALILMQLGYLVVAKGQRRQASWPVVVAGMTTIIVLRALDLIAPSAVFAAVALVVVIWGAIDRQLLRPGALQTQALGMLGFGALALVGLIVDPDLGRYLVAAGLFLHGIWDLVHFRLDKVVARSHAEWCFVVDIILAVELAFKL